MARCERCGGETLIALCLTFPDIVLPSDDMQRQFEHPQVVERLPFREVSASGSAALPFEI